MAEPTLRNYKIRHGQAAGQASIGGAGVWWLARGYDYDEWAVPYETRDALYAEIPLGTVLQGTTTGACSVIYDAGGPTTKVIATAEAFAEDMVDETMTITDVDDFTIASRASMKVCTLTGDARPSGYVASTASGAPVKDNGTSTVTAAASIFTQAMVGWQLAFKATGKGYVIASYVGGTQVKVTGDASGEADGDVIATCSNQAFSIPVAPLTGMYVAHRELAEHRVGEPGRSTIRAWYSTPQWYRPDTSQKIRGKVYIDRGGILVPLLYSVDGEQIEGPGDNEAEDLAGISWVHTRGNREVWIPRVKYRLLAAATADWDGAILEALVGKINSTVALSSAVGTLRFDGTHEQITVFYSGRPIRQVELLFTKNLLGWNSDIYTLKCAKRVVAVPVMDKDGNETGLTAKAIHKIRVAADPVGRSGYDAVDFAIFQNMLDL